MIDVSVDYKNATKSKFRNSYVFARYGLYNKTAKRSTSVIGVDASAFSNTPRVLNEMYDTEYNYITLEPDKIKLDGTFYFINDKTKPDDNQFIGYWSGTLSDANGNISGSALEFITSGLIDPTPLTLFFAEIVSSFKIEYFKCCG